MATQPIYKNSKFFAVLGAVIVFGIIFFILLNQVIMPAYTNHDEGVTVPNITRISLEEAKKNLDSYGLRYAIAKRQSNDAFPANYVIDQRPEPAKIVKPHRKIYLTVNSVSNPTVEVPKLEGLSLRNAKIQLSNANLKLGAISYRSSRFRNTILDQSVESGEIIKQGAKIDLVVSDGMGQANVNIPQIVGLPLGEAEQKLHKKGLAVGEIRYRPSSKAPKTVLDYTPKRAGMGQKIKLIIAEKTGNKEPRESSPVIDTTQSSHQQ